MTLFILYEFVSIALDGSLFLSNRNIFGDTPLHLLARNNKCIGVVKLLIRSGASLTVRNKQVGKSDHFRGEIHNISKILNSGIKYIFIQ